MTKPPRIESVSKLDIESKFAPVEKFLFSTCETVRKRRVYKANPSYSTIVAKPEWDIMLYPKNGGPCVAALRVWIGADNTEVREISWFRHPDGTFYEASLY